MLLAQAAAEGTGILCTILLIATIIAFIIGLAEALGVVNLTGGRAGRFGTLVVAVVLLVIYLVVC